MSTKNTKKKKGNAVSSMNTNRQKKSRQERTLTGSTNAKSSRSPKTPPKYSKSGTQGSSSLTYGSMTDKSKPIGIISSATGLRFQDQPVLCFKPTSSGHRELSSKPVMVLSRSRTGDGGVSQSMPSSNKLQLSHLSHSSPSSPSHSTSSKDGNELSKVQHPTTHYIPKQHIQLKRKRKNQGQNGSTTTTTTGNATANGARPTFQFKIGMQVGVALGDCFLQLQKLENSMDHLRNVSEDITDVMSCIEQMQPQRGGGGGSRGRKKSESGT